MLLLMLCRMLAMYKMPDMIAIFFVHGFKEYTSQIICVKASRAYSMHQIKC